MPGVCREGDLGKTGHKCTFYIGVFATQGSVFANGIPLNRVSDPAMPHTGIAPPYCKPHPSKINMASRTVFAKGIGIARVGDSFDMGAMIKGSRNVFANGGGGGGYSQSADPSIEDVR
jgi:uncharacterized Zn-binding protein involved in type VI secretion